MWAQGERVQPVTVIAFSLALTLLQFYWGGLILKQLRKLLFGGAAAPGVDIDADHESQLLSGALSSSDADSEGVVRCHAVPNAPAAVSPATQTQQRSPAGGAGPPARLSGTYCAPTIRSDNGV